MASVLCPDCGRKIVIGPKPKKGQAISCPHCNIDLEIISISPLELDWAAFDEDESLDDSFEGDEFWDEDDDEEDDWDDDEDEDEDWDDEDEDF